MKKRDILASIRASMLAGIFCVGPSCHRPAGARAVTLFTRSGATAAISSAIQPPKEFPAT